MAEQLVIYLKDIETLSADWVFTHASGEAVTVSDSGSISELVEKNKNEIENTKKLVCIINAAHIHYSQLNIPAKNKQRALQAIPFALEDQLAEDVELMHFATGNPVQSIYPVATIRHEILQQLLETLAESGIKPDTLYADILCLPLAVNGWNIYMNQDTVTIQLSNGEVIHADTESLPVFINSLITQDTLGQPEEICFWMEESSSLPALELPEEIKTRQHLYQQSPVTLFSGNLSQTQPLNLLQGRYKVTHESNQWWKPWRSAAIFAAVVIVFELVNSSLTLQRLQTENSNLDKEITRIYKQSFPRSKKIINARVQMENKLKQLAKNSGTAEMTFTDILMNAAPVFQQTSNIELQGINYHNRKMEIQLTLDKLSTAETLKNRLNGLSGIKAELLSASSEAKKVNARIRLEAI